MTITIDWGYVTLIAMLAATAFMYWCDTKRGGQ